MSEWKEYKLGEVADILPGYAFKSKDFGKSGIPVIKIKDIAPSSINMLGTECVDTSAYELSKISKYIIGKGDYVVAMTGATIGKIGRQKENILAYLNQRVARIKAKEGICDNFIYYTISGEAFQQFVQNNIDSNSAQENISATSIGRYPLMLPPLDEQKRIAGVLSSLDDKIDLLHRENATLEALAETLFRHYFIENPNPSWKEGKLGDILSVKGGTTPSTNEPKYWNGNIAWTSPRDVTTLNGMYLFKTERTITEEGLAKISSGLLPAGTLLMSSRAPVGVLAFAEIPVAINQGYIAIIDDKGYPKEFIYLWLKENMDAVHSYSNGSTFMEISKTAFKSLDITIPDEETVKVFTTQVKPIFSKIKSNQQQMQTLATQRDTLLPCLMSGEVKVYEQ